MEAIHRVVAPLGAEITVPSELYYLCFRIYHNQPMKWGFFKDKRNASRSVIRKRSWDKFEKELGCHYYIPKGCKIKIRPKHHYKGAVSFSFVIGEHK